MNTTLKFLIFSSILFNLALFSLFIEYPSYHGKQAEVSLYEYEMGLPAEQQPIIGY